MKQTKLMLVVLGASLFYQGLAFSVEIERDSDQQFEIQIGTSKVQEKTPKNADAFEIQIGTSKAKGDAAGYVDKSTCDQACRSTAVSATKPTGRKTGKKTPDMKMKKSPQRKLQAKKQL